MDTDWLVFHPNPKKPDFRLPEGAIDAHCHVFGPARQFPFAPTRKYTPGDAGKAQLFALRDHLGFARNVIVQATCHGHDNSALLDALDTADGRARGVVSVSPDISEEALADMDRRGVRAVRFNFLRRLVDDAPREDFLRIADKVKTFGWHVVVYFEAADLAELIPFLRRLPTPIVVDHMGRPDIEKGVAHPDFQRFLSLMDSQARVFCKVTCPERLSRLGPPYDDVVPFARSLTKRFPRRVLWGTDWPHPNMKSHMPDDGALVDFIPRIAPDASAQRQLLVDNPMDLYWPEEAAP